MKKKYIIMVITALILLVLSGCNSNTVYITEVSFGPKYIETNVSEDDTINSPSASSNVVSVLLSNGKEYTAKDGGVLTLVINGCQYDILKYYRNKTELIAGEYSFETTKGSEEYSETVKLAYMAGNVTQYTFRQALRVNEEGIVKEETIESLLLNVEAYDEKSLKNGTICSYGPFFNGIIIDSTNYKIENVVIKAEGDGGNDFQGEGAMVISEGNADVTIKDTIIFTKGAIRAATVAKENGILRLDNVLIYTEETDDSLEEYSALVVPMMKRVPFALGLEGTVRSTNVLNNGQGIYTNSLIVSSGWGVLATDSGTSFSQTGTYALDVSNTVAGTGVVEEAIEGKEYFATKTINGTKYGYLAGGAGYVAYAEAGVYDRFDNVKFYGGNIVQIMASKNSSAFYTNSVLISGHIGVMTQQNAGGTISLKDSVLSVGETAIEIKSGAVNDGYTNIEIDNTEINFTSDAIWGNTLIELMESDDAGSPGNTSFTIDDRGDEATIDTAISSVADTTATISNGTYTGNIWNNIYHKYQKLDVTISNATLNGTISSSYAYHLTDDGERMPNGTILKANLTGDYRISDTTDYLKIGALYNVASPQIANPIDVTLTDNSTWNIYLADGTNGEAKELYLNNLTVLEGSNLKANTAVIIHIYGEACILGQLDENITIIQEEQ